MMVFQLRPPPNTLGPFASIEYDIALWDRTALIAPEPWQEVFKTFHELHAFDWPNFQGPRGMSDGLQHRPAIKTTSRIMLSRGQCAFLSPSHDPPLKDAAMRIHTMLQRIVQSGT